MSYIIVREGPYQYLRSVRKQREAIRFPTRADAKRALRRNNCLHSSTPCRIVRLVRRDNRAETKRILDEHGRKILAIAEMVDLLSRSLCRDARMSIALNRLRAAQPSGDSKP